MQLFSILNKTTKGLNPVETDLSEKRLLVHAYYKLRHGRDSPQIMQCCITNCPLKFFLHMLYINITTKGHIPTKTDPSRKIFTNCSTAHLALSCESLIKIHSLVLNELRTQRTTISKNYQSWKVLCFGQLHTVVYHVWKFEPNHSTDVGAVTFCMYIQMRPNLMDWGGGA